MQRSPAPLIALGLLALAAFAGPAAAQSPSPPPTPQEQATAETDRANLRDFDLRRRVAATHPNELHRLYGAEAAGKGQWRDAAGHFRRAARYADKYSQHRLSLIHWHGLDGPADRALAYVWADLAAERQYPQFVLLREKMWLDMSQDERDRALREGVALYREYGDEAAKPRFERALARGRAGITGSRLGATADRLRVTAASGGSGLFDPGDSVDLAPMYAAWRLDSRRYWAVEDAVWQNGSVEVGPSETVREAPARP